MLTADLIVKLVGLLLSSQAKKQFVIDEMAESVPLRIDIKDCLTRQGVLFIRGLHRKGLAEREEKDRMLLS